MADSDFQSPPLQALQAEFDSYLKTKWGEDALRNSLSKRKISLQRFEVTYRVQNREKTMSKPYSNADLLLFDLVGYGGDLALVVQLTVDGVTVQGAASDRYGGKGSMLASATQPLVRRVARQLAQQVLSMQSTP